MKPQGPFERTFEAVLRDASGIAVWTTQMTAAESFQDMLATGAERRMDIDNFIPACTKTVPDQFVSSPVGPHLLAADSSPYKPNFAGLYVHEPPPRLRHHVGSPGGTLCRPKTDLGALGSAARLSWMTRSTTATSQPDARLHER